MNPAKFSFINCVHKIRIKEASESQSRNIIVNFI